MNLSEKIERDILASDAGDATDQFRRMLSWKARSAIAICGSVRPVSIAAVWARPRTCSRVDQDDADSAWSGHSAVFLPTVVLRLSAVGKLHHLEEGRFLDIRALDGQNGSEGVGGADR